MKIRSGVVSMVTGGLLILSAGLLALYNGYENYRAGESARSVVDQLKDELDASRDYVGKPEDLILYPYDNEEMPVKNIDGYDYVGYLSLPSLGLELPVMAEWDYPRLKIAPCRQQGTIKNDDLVIAAHNYDNHFGRLATLSLGAEVVFVTMNGVKVPYEVLSVEEVPPLTDVVFADEADLTLYTCTLSGQTRVLVRCGRVEGALQFY